MTTFAIDGTPKDILAATTLDVDGNASALTANTTYVVQAELPTAGGSGPLERFGPPYIHIEDTTAAPTTNLERKGHKLRHQKSARVSGANIWVWCISNEAAFISVHEEP